MGTVNVVLGEDTRLNLILGQQLENAVTEVVFDFSAWHTTYGAGTLALSVQRPGDEMPYAVALTTSGTDATWSVTNLDTAYKGVGHIQLTYTVGSAIKKSVVYKFTVYESLGANGEYPSPGQTWQEEIEDELADVKQDLSELQDEVYTSTLIMTGISPANGWRLNESDGLCSSDSNYMLVKYQVVEGQKLKIVSDDRFQFQTVASVPSSGTSNRVGDTTYGVGTFILTVPTGATYLIFSTPKTDSQIAVYKTESNIADLQEAEKAYNTQLYTIGTLTLLKNNGFLNASGVFNSNSYYKTSDFIPVKAGQVIKYNLRTTSSLGSICFYTDNNEGSFSERVAGTGGYSAGEYTIQSDGYIRFCTENYQLSNAYCYIEMDMNKNMVSKDEAKMYMHDKSLTLAVVGIDDLMTINGLINLYGKYGANNSYRVTDFIRVNEGQKVRYNLRGTTTLTILAFYTERNENSFVSASSVVGTGAYVAGEWTAPSDGYIRGCCENYKFNLAYLYTELEPNKRNFGGDAVEKNLNVLLMGDSIFGNDGEIASYLSEMCKSCVNGAFGGTRVSVRPYTSDAFRFFDGVNIITALCTQTWTDQDAGAESLASDYPWITARLAGLKAVDMSEIDLLIMDWGTNDYTAGATIEDITTAYGTVIDLLQETYPELRILITTPIWRYWGTEADNENGDNKVYNVSTLKEIALAIEDFMKNKRISVLNAYQNLPLSYKTALTYFDANDKTHLNTFGNKVYAYLLHGKIRSIY